MKITKSFQTIDFEQVKEYEIVRKNNWSGFAEVYLDRCNKESGAGVEADIVVYTKLAELDSRLGTRTSEQLYGCLHKTTRWDIIKVRIETLNISFKLFQSIDLGQVNENVVRKKDGVGFAHAYLDRCEKESKSDDEIDIQVYTKLVELDSRLDTTAAEQLFYCVKKTQRLDLIKVSIHKRQYKIVTLNSAD